MVDPPPSPPLAYLPPGDPDSLRDFPNLVNGMGEYKGETVRIHADEFITPVAQPHRRIPFYARKQVEEKLMQLESDGVIARAEDSTTWVWPIMLYQSH